MKKICRILLVLTIVICGFAVVNIFNTKDLKRVQNIEMTSNSFNFYVSESKISSNQELIFFEQLAKKYDVSIVKTINDDSSNQIIKAAVYSENSFPHQNFGLSVKFDENKIYSSFARNGYQRTIPVFSASNKIILESLSRYYQSSNLSTNGIYAVVSTNTINQQAISKELSDFFGISQAQLLNSTNQGNLEILNQILLILLYLLGLLILLLAVLIIYNPLTRIKEIGVKKLHGYSNFSIFSDFVKFDIVLIFLVSLLFDVWLILAHSFLPNGLLISIIASQIFILFFYLLLNLSTFILIQKITISNLLKNAVNLKAGIFSVFGLKVLLSVVVTALLIMISVNMNQFFGQIKTNQAWQKYGNVLVVDYYNETGQAAQDGQLGNNHDSLKLATLNTQFDQKLGAYYIDSENLNPYKMLSSQGSQVPQLFSAQDNFWMMTVNENYFKTLNLNVPEKLDFSAKARTFLVPKTYENRKAAIKYLCQSDLLSTISYQESLKTDVNKIPVNIIYYEPKNQENFTYNSQEPFVKKAIYALISPSNLTENEKMYALNSGTSNPWKIKNTAENRKLLNQLISPLLNYGLQIHYSTINSMMTSSAVSFRESINILSSILAIVVILSISVSGFLFLTIIQSRKKELAIYQFMGYKMRDKYKIECLILSGIAIIQLAVLLIFSQSTLIVILFAILFVIDILITLIIVRNREQKSLIHVLKGENG